VSMPQIPEEKFRPSLEEVVIDLLASIALEETALSHLIHAEAEKIQMFVGQYKDSSFISSKEIVAVNQSVNRMMETIVMKEWLLLKKLEDVLQIEVQEEWDEE